MSNHVSHLERTVTALRPVMPAKTFHLSKRFYIELGFRPRVLGERLVELELGGYAFILQDHYVKEWADNCVMHVLVTDLAAWWEHIRALDLPARYDGVRTGPPKPESWGLVAGVIDPSGVLLRFTQANIASNLGTPS
jgi:hypothetical protein